MTILEALSGSVNYPVDENKLKKILVDRGLSDTETYTKEVGLGMAFQLATADVYTLLVSSANIAEGGYSVSMTDKSNMIKLANGIYSKYGIDSPFQAVIVDRSNYW